MKIPDCNTYRREAFARNPPGSTAKLENALVGVAGAGGLGSNIATALVRAGVSSLVVADFDVIEMSNLNRQQFFLDQVGQPKVEALRENLLRINPHANIEAHTVRVDENNVNSIFRNCEIMVEAFDDAKCKAMLANTWPNCFPDRYLVMASGLAGIGKSTSLKVCVHGKLIICGDMVSESCPETGLIAPRVAIAANMQANVVIELLLTGKVTL